MSFTRVLKTCSIKRFLNYAGSRSDHHLAPARYAQTLLNLPETRVTTLNNGLRISTEQTDAPASTVGLWIEAGSRYETQETNGVANFVEHLIFRGSNQRNRPDMHHEIQKLGARITGYTCREDTAFYARCLANDVPNLVALLGDMVLNPRLEEEDIEETRAAVLKELKDVENDHRQVTFDYLHLTAYQGTPLSWSVCGSTGNIEQMKKEDIALYHRDNITIAPRMVLCGSGSVDHDQLVKLAEKTFSSVPESYTREIPMISACRFTGSEVRARDDWLPFAHVAVAVDTCGVSSDDIYPLMLAKTHVGSWDKTLISSPNTRNTLVQNIHRANGCHSFESFHILYRDSGLWGCYFVMDRMLLDDFMYNLQDEWMKLCVSVTEVDLMVAKNTLRNNLLSSLDNSVNSCADMAKQILVCGERLPFSEVEEKIQDIDLKRFRDTCGKYIYDRCLAVSAFGPVEAMTDYNRVRSNMYWIRY